MPEIRGLLRADGKRFARLGFPDVFTEELGSQNEIMNKYGLNADNLVIARAQMIKERVLGGADRRLGQRPADWRARLDTTAGGPLPPQT